MTDHVPEHENTGGEISPQPAPAAFQPLPSSPSTSAIIAFVFGILAFITCGPCTGIPALILGLIELRNIRNGMSSVEGKPFALVGAILGGINVALIFVAILIYIVIIMFAIAVPGIMGPD